MIVIYTPKVTNRIKYTLDFVFSQYFGMEYNLTENPDFTVIPENLYINYSDQKIEHVFSVFQHDLLLEENIHDQKPFVTREKELPVFFQTTDHFDLKFDIFSCIFYLLSRYEEYLPHEKDNHERYKSSNSVLSKKEFNFSPIVETWLEFFKQTLLSINTDLLFKQYKFEYLPTFDIDNAFQYLGRDWFKRPPNIFSKEVINVLRKKQPDPYDTFDFIFREIHKSDLNATFFFLMWDEESEDSNVSPHSKSLNKIINRIADEDINTGIHFSYGSMHKNLFETEKKMLADATNKQATDILISRQHFLKIRFPDYFRAIINAGIQQDFSLAYPDVTGFRSGYSRAFFFFDLIKNETTNLLLQSSCWMDATYEYYQTKNFEQIEQESLVLMNQIKKINGKLVPIFHNDLFAKDIFKRLFVFINQYANQGDEN